MKIKMLFFLLSSVFFASCSNDESTSGILSSGITQSKLIEVKQASKIDFVYSDRRTGAALDVSIWRADLSQDAGYYSLGDVAVSGYRAPKMLSIVRAEGDLLAAPIDYENIWDDRGSGGSYDISIWQPLPPAGYRCLGHVVNHIYEKPSKDRIRCVREEFLVKGKSQFIWNDRKSGANRDVEIHEVMAADVNGLALGTFISQPRHHSDGGDLYYTLDKNKVSRRALPAFKEINAEVARKFAPRVYLHGGEKYFPSSVNFFLGHINVTEGFLVTKQPLGCDSCTEPQFLDGQRPDQSPVPIYAQIVNRPKVGAKVTDLIYWMFYPYNNGKRVCIGAYISGVGCIGGYSTFGSHVGDWEHFTIRFVGGVPTQVAMSSHGESSVLAFNDRYLEFVDQTHPVIYSANGSHGLYPYEGRNRYKNLPNGDFLADDMSRSIVWDTWQSLEAFTYQQPGSYSGSLSWLNLRQRWGNPKSGCGFSEKISGECVLNDGPVAPMQKSFAQPDFADFEQIARAIPLL